MLYGEVVGNTWDKLRLSLRIRSFLKLNTPQKFTAISASISKTFKTLEICYYWFFKRTVSTVCVCGWDLTLINNKTNPEDNRIWIQTGKRTLFMYHRNWLSSNWELYDDTIMCAIISTSLSYDYTPQPVSLSAHTKGPMFKPVLLSGFNRVLTKRNFQSVWWGPSDKRDL